MKPPDEKRPIGPRQVLAVLLPILGCGVLAWQGAHRPERMILGKWRSNATSVTIEFKEDGTYLALRRRSAPALLLRQWGRYRFLDRDHLRFEPLGNQQEPPSDGRMSVHIWLPDTRARIDRDSVEVGPESVVANGRVTPFGPSRSDVWKRIE